MSKQQLLLYQCLKCLPFYCFKCVKRFTDQLRTIFNFILKHADKLHLLEKSVAQKWMLCFLVGHLTHLTVQSPFRIHQLRLRVPSALFRSFSNNWL